MPKFDVDGVVFVLIPKEDNPAPVHFKARVDAVDFIDAMRVWDKQARSVPGYFACKSEEIIPVPEEEKQSS